MKGNINNRRRILTAILLFAVLIYSAVKLIHYAISSVSTKQTNDQLQKIFHSAEESPLPETESTPPPEISLPETYQYIGGSVLPGLKNLLSENHDTVAWLTIPGGIVDLPVVYRDNTYYLDHDFYGKKSSAGTLFLDEQHPFLADTQYLVIHGHNMQDGSMFGLLSHYRRKGYMEKHPTVIFTTLYRQEKYEVIGVLEVPIDARKEGYVPYIGMRKFHSPEQFKDYIDLIRQNALYWKRGADITPADALMALSTCYEDNRVVVFLKRISP